MPERTHLSIREVLDLLVVEFPDVTISKIRFLESRGLIHPERTPSGYRRFYDEDVERLRWILRQQREHFLPLRVIKGRLDQGGSEPSLPFSPSLFESESAPVDDDAAPGEADLLVHAVARNGATDLLGANAGLEARGPVSRPQAAGALGTLAPAASRSAAALRVASTAPSPDPPASGRARSRPRAPAPTTSAAFPDEPDATAAPVATAGDNEAARASRAAGASPDKGGTSAGAPPFRKQVGPTDDGAADAPPPPVPAPRREDRGAGVMAVFDPRPSSGASLTADELAVAANIDPDVLAELLDYGLIEGRSIAGVVVYDEDALVVASLAGSCRRFGIESRHLRAFKHAAEREAGLYAQVVTPLLRQRNPESRERALADLTELAELGGKLRGAFLRSELRSLSGG